MYPTYMFVVSLRPALMEKVLRDQRLKEAQEKGLEAVGQLACEIEGEMLTADATTRLIGAAKSQQQQQQQQQQRGQQRQKKNAASGGASGAGAASNARGAAGGGGGAASSSGDVGGAASSGGSAGLQAGTNGQSYPSVVCVKCKQRGHGRRLCPN